MAIKDWKKTDEILFVGSLNLLVGLGASFSLGLFFLEKEYLAGIFVALVTLLSGFMLIKYMIKKQ